PPRDNRPRTPYCRHGRELFQLFQAWSKEVGLAQGPAPRRLVPTLRVGMPLGTLGVPAVCHATSRLPAATPSVAPGIPTPSVGTRDSHCSPAQPATDPGRPSAAPCAGSRLGGIMRQSREKG